MALVPDEVKAMGSRHPGPPARPVAHIWRLRSGIADDHRLDDHFEALLAKLVGSAERVRALIKGAEVGGEFVIGWYFEPGPEEERTIEPGRQNRDFERLRGQHPLLGFVITPGLVAYAALAGLGFDFDEYGDEYE